MKYRYLKNVIDTRKMPRVQKNLTAHYTILLLQSIADDNNNVEFTYKKLIAMLAEYYFFETTIKKLRTALNILEEEGLIFTCLEETKNLKDRFFTAHLNTYDEMMKKGTEKGIEKGTEKGTDNYLKTNSLGGAEGTEKGTDKGTDKGNNTNNLYTNNLNTNKERMNDSEIELSETSGISSCKRIVHCWNVMTVGMEERVAPCRMPNDFIKERIGVYVDSYGEDTTMRALAAIVASRTNGYFIPDYTTTLQSALKEDQFSKAINGEYTRGVDDEEYAHSLYCKYADLPF